MSRRSFSLTGRMPLCRRLSLSHPFAEEIHSPDMFYHGPEFDIWAIRHLIQTSLATWHSDSVEMLRLGERICKKQIECARYSSAALRLPLEDISCSFLLELERVFNANLTRAKRTFCLRFQNRFQPVFLSFNGFARHDLAREFMNSAAWERLERWCTLFAERPR